jgi:hypothetical protein
VESWIGEQLRLYLLSRQVPEKKRDCYQKLWEYLTGDDRQVCGISGLRRTGKTVMMEQAMLELGDFDHSLYITCDFGDSFNELKSVIKKYEPKYLFIDEITAVPDFIDRAAPLSDVYSGGGTKVVITGTDSLSFYFASKDSLFCRSFYIHTTYIPYKEHARLLGTSLDDYLEYGGTLFKEGSFLDGRAALIYIDSSIVDNITHSIKNWNGRNYDHLKKYNLESIANAIRIFVEKHNADFIKKSSLESFQSGDIGSLRELLKKNGVEIPGLEGKELQKEVREALHIRELREEDRTLLDDANAMLDLRRYLENMAVILNISSRVCPEYVFSQPGLRYSQAKEIVRVLLEGNALGNLDDMTRAEISKRLLSDIKGQMLEDIVKTDLVMNPIFQKDRINEVFDVYRIRKFGSDSGEFDITICNAQTKAACVMEVKHSDKQVPEQTKHLKNEELCKEFEKRTGCRIVRRMVIYNGPDTYLPGETPIYYANASDFLCEKNSFQKMVAALTEVPEREEEKEDEYEKENLT